MGLVLLTGATGFVGRQVLRELLRRKLGVRAVVRNSKVEEISDRYEFESVLGTDDLFRESADWWSEACRGVDTVIHLAWYAEPGKYLHSPINITCLHGTLALAEGAIAAGVRRFVGVGTCFEYDTSSEFLSKKTSLLPLSTYAGAKAAAYFALSNWFDQVGLEFVWCRLFFLYGEGEDHRRLVPYLRAQLAAGQPVELTSGLQIRDYLDVGVAAEMIVDDATGKVKGATNICSGRAVTIGELAESIADEYGRRDLLKFGVRPDNVFDPPRVVGVR